MNYRHVYMLIIEHAKSEEKLGIRKRDNGNYYERHHILPRSLFPLWKSRKSNVVLLTAREHFFCHQLLVKIYPCYKMACALQMICKNWANDIILSSREYQKVREAIALYQSKCKWYTNGIEDVFTDVKPDGFIEGRSKGYSQGLTSMWRKGPWNKGTKGLQVGWCKGKHIDNHWTGKHHTEESKKKISESRKGMPSSFKGKHHTEASKEKSRRAHIGKKMSEEFREKQRQIAKGKVWWTNGIEDKFAVECPSGFYKGRTKVKGWKRDGN